jgi:hypothetical protein
MKPLTIPSLLVLSVAVVVAGCSQTGESKQPDTAMSHPDNEMSAAFREQARRAFDAIDRVPEMGSKEYPHSGFDVRELDAEKAIAEAKYKAMTGRDKEVLDLLGAALYGRTAPERRPLLDPDHIKLIKMGVQCEMELRAEFEPERLTDAGLKQARGKTCLTLQKEILDESQRRIGLDKSQ